MIGTAIYTLLTSDATLNSLCSNISVLRELENVTAPFLIYSIDGVDPLQTKDGVSPLDEVRLNLNMFSETDLEVNQIADAARNLLERYTGTVESEVLQSIRFELQYNTFDNSSKLFNVVQEYTIRHQK